MVQEGACVEEREGSVLAVVAAGERTPGRVIRERVMHGRVWMAAWSRRPVSYQPLARVLYELGFANMPPTSARHPDGFRTTTQVLRAFQVPHVLARRSRLSISVCYSNTPPLLSQQALSAIGIGMATATIG